jgi:protein ImuB
MFWACLFLPSLPLDVFARGHSPADAVKPFAVTSGGRTPRVVNANAVARDAGIHPGQLVSASLALAPDLVLRERDPVAEVAALEAVASWATQFTPTVAVAAPNAVLAEIGSSLRLFGGLSRLKARLARGARDLGYAPQWAFAATSAAALLLAKSRVRDDFSANGGGENRARQKVVSDPTFEGERSKVVSDPTFDALPLCLAEADPDAIATLAAAGITTFGAAFALPRAALARRVGTDFVDLLDRIRGLAPEVRPLFVPPPRYTGKLDLPAPVANVEALAFAVNRLVFEMAGWLTGRRLGVTAMSLTLAHERYVGVATGVRATSVRFSLAAPAREPAHLVSVLRERLTRVALPAPVESITLASEAIAPLASENLGLLPGDNDRATVPLLDRLRARLGEDAVTLVALHAEHRPERSSREVRIETQHAAPRADRQRMQKSRTTGKRASADAAAPSFACRPVWLLAMPEPLVNFAGHREAQRWVLRDGPERIESGWWDGADVRRDYFIAENPRGEIVWIYRDHRFGIDDGEWFVHGLFA